MGVNALNGLFWLMGVNALNGLFSFLHTYTPPKAPTEVVSTP